jgi:hypothetical protein
MSQATIINAAPMVIQRGTQDLSTRLVPREAEATPQHLPKFYLYAKKGPLTPQLVSGAELTQMYGADSFDLRKKWANHATVFANLVNAEGNAIMVERVIPEDAGPESNMLLSLDVLPTKVALYERNTDGSIKLDTANNPVPTGTSVDGYKVKWVLTNLSDQSGVASPVTIDEFGSATIVPGDQVDSTTNIQSQRYPLLQFKVSTRGAFGNDSGIRLWAPTVNSTVVPSQTLMSSQKTYPFLFSVIRRADPSSSPAVVETIFGEQQMTVCLKPGTIDPVSDKQMYIGDILLDAYQNVNDPKYPAFFGDFGTLAVYDDNIKTLVDKFYAAEHSHIDAFSDFTGAADESYLFNFLTGQSSQAVPYHSFQVVSASNAVRMSEYSNIFAGGGSDGTLDDALFAELVETKVVEYADSNSQLQDIAVNVESIIYDSGFPLKTKYALCSFISERKDTFVVLSTHDVNDRKLSASEENSLAIALRTHLQMYPESDYYGTPVMRGMIVGRSGKLRNSQYNKRVPLTAEIAIKSARYMGAGDGRWKNGKHFDGAPGSIVDYVYDVSINFTPSSVRNKDWDVGLNWVQSYDRRSLFFPALKTVYNDDTSVLNSYFTALAIGQLNKVAHKAWREFSGVSYLTNAQLVQRVNDFVTANTQGRFDDRYIVVPEAYFSELDTLRGFSWTLPIKIYSPNMLTVMTTMVQAYRIGDYAASA